MGLFNQEDKEAKQAQKVQKLMAKYGLQDLSDPRDYKAVEQIAYDLAGNKLIELGTALQGNATDMAKLTYMSALMQQNFIIIRQLDRLNANLERK